MSGPTVSLAHNANYGWYLAWGQETFYDEQRNWRTWDSPEQAANWLRENHPKLRLIEHDEEPPAQEYNPGPDESLQLSLFEVNG